MPLAIAAFIILGFLIDLPFLDHIDASQITAKSAKKVFESIGIEAFIRNNHLLFGLFMAAIILWVTEAIPNYLTSLVLIVSLVLTGVLPEKEAYAQLRHPVTRLNIMSFVLASMLVATGVAKRLALWFILRFRKNASTIFISFIIINLILSAFI